MIFLHMACAPQNQSLPPQREPSSQEKYDAIIIGGGASGMAAARRLIELGHEPLIIEKQDILGGAGIHAGRFYAVETEWQEQQGIEDSVASALGEWTERTKCSPHPALEDFLSQSSGILEWIGNEYFDKVQYTPDSGWRIHPMNDAAGVPPLRIWSENLSSYANFNTTISELIVENNSAVGVIDTDGKRFYSSRIIVATGGFGRNLDYVNLVYPEFGSSNWHTETWPEAHGLGFGLFTDYVGITPYVSLHVHGVTDAYIGQPEVMVVGSLSKSLIVNQTAERLFNEEDFEQLHFAGEVYGENTFFALFDDELWQNTAFKSFSFNHPENADQSYTSAEYQAVTDVVTAETWQQLAQILDIPNALENTVNNYNNSVNDGVDALGKDLENIPKLSMPPFYALPLKYATGRSFNGVQTDENMQVCNDGGCIEGVYAVGELQGLMCADNGGYNGSITAAIYAGYTAANHAVGEN